MNSASEEDDMMKGEALIRANFGVDPATLSPDEWARLCSEALWIETWRLKNEADMLGRLFGSGQKESRPRG